MFSRLWQDDTGAVVSVELGLIVSVLLAGTVPGLIAVRDGVNRSHVAIGNMVANVAPTFTYSGLRTHSAQVGGFAVQNTPVVITLGQLPPVPVISPIE